MRQASFGKSQGHLQNLWRDGNGTLSCCQKYSSNCHRCSHQCFESHRQRSEKWAESSCVKSSFNAARTLQFNCELAIQSRGQAISFLAQHTWLVIVAGVAFLITTLIKKRRLCYAMNSTAATPTSPTDKDSCFVYFLLRIRGRFVKNRGRGLFFGLLVSKLWFLIRLCRSGLKDGCFLGGILMPLFPLV